MMRIKEIDPQSPFFGYVREGYEVKSVNGQPVLDAIDFRYKTTDEQVRIVFADKKGEEIVFEIEDDFPGDLGLVLDDGRVMVCDNNCIFCFVHQQPKGMRRALYVKDEDYRLSFTHGNFVTLTNVTDEQIERIIEQRLSPLYVSVHATDDKLRRCMLKNEKIAPILPRLRHLIEKGISIHTQCVLCPEINDGANLEKTIDELSALYPGVASLAVVPVGLTKYRKKLPDLRKYTADEAASVIDFIERRQRGFLKKQGSRFVWVADEFYVEANRSFPKHSEYEDMPQFENGVGMAREFIITFNRRRVGLSRLKSKRRVLALTGESAYPFLSAEILPYVREYLKLDLDFQAVQNRFWGDMVTVSGLLTGDDLLSHVRSSGVGYDAVMLPPNCLNDDDLFLDDMSVEEFKGELGREVIIGQYNFAESLKEAFA